MGLLASDSRSRRVLRASLFATLVVATASCDRSVPPPAAEPSAPAPIPSPAQPPDVLAPTQPQQLAASASAGTIELTWIGSGDDRGVEGYDVFRGEERIASGAARGARDAGLRGATQYCYTVVAFDAAGNRSEPSAPACAVAPDVTAPSTPAALSASLAAPTEIRLRWDAATDDVGVTGYEVVTDERVVASPREAGARLASLAPGRQYCLAVRAIDGAGNRSPASEPACAATPDLTAPSAPGEVAAAATPGRVELRWGAATDDVAVVGYEVVRDGKIVAKTAATSASEARLPAGAKVCYLVRALDAAGHRSVEAGPACATPPDVTPPSTPGSLTAKAEGETVIALRWQAATDDVGVVRYEALRDGKVVAGTGATDPGAAATETRVNGLRAAREYCHVVRACDRAGNCSAPSAPACATTPDLTPPTMVAKVSAKPLSDKEMAVRWSAADDNVGVARYVIRRDGATMVVTSGDALDVSDEGLRPATRYCYTVVAEDAAGNTSRPSSPACAVTPDLVPPSQPPKVAVAPRSGSAVAITWDSSTDDVGVAGYEVLRDGKVVPAEMEGTQATLAGLSAETEYCHAVRAFDAAGNRSKPSEPLCVRTTGAETPTAPWKLRAYTTPAKELLLTWDVPAEPDVVYVVYWDGKRGADRRVATTPTTRFTVFGKAAEARHCYRIAALNEKTMRESPRTFPVCDALPVGVSAAAEQGAGAGGDAR